MVKEKQTKEVIQELYNLTRQFTRALVDRYYYQYRGDVDDLAGDFFVQFMTPKASGDRKKETLLDKFDESITSLAYLVKVSVARKLIDQSRQHPYIIRSIDQVIEENGDGFMLILNDLEEDKKRTIFRDESLISKIKVAFNKLPESIRNERFVELFDTASSLTQYLEPVLHKVRNCPIQQVTSRTAVVYIPIACTFVLFDVETGKPRGSFKPFTLNEEELKQVRALAVYHSSFTKELLQEFLEKSHN